MATLDQLRSLFPNAATDADVITQAADRYGISPAEIASEVGYSQSRSGLTGQQFSSAIDRYQAGLYGVGEAALGALGAESASGWMAAQRRENELRADLASERAREMGAVQEWKDVHGIGDFGSYAKGLAIQSVPYAAEALAGGLVTRGLMSGTRAALAGAQTVEELAAAKKALNIGSTVGGVAASYPSAVGDVLSNQREEGQTNFGAAAALGVPYAALNAFGVEGALSRGMGARAVNMLDRTTGVTGAALRTGSSMAKSGAQEAVGETLQEVTNQLGRMAVNPNVSLTDEAALERYKESAIGGAVLGGAFGSVGGWRRSSSFLPGSNQSGETPTTPDAPKNEISQEFTAKSEASAENLMAGLAGQPNLLGGRAGLYEGATVPAPPVVAGGETDVAFAQQQANAENQATQAALQQQATRERIYSEFGIADPQNPTKGNLFGKPIYGPAVPAVADAVAAVTQNMTPTQLAIAQAVNQASAATGNMMLNYQFNANDPVKSVQKAFDAVGKVATGLQIGHVQSVDEAAQILNEQSNSLKGQKLDQLNAVYSALTGEDTAGYIAAQQPKATKGAKDGKLQLQTNAGVGEVPVQGGAGEAISGGAGAVRPAQVQPVGAGSVGAGPTGQQAGQPTAGGVRTGTSADTGVGVSEPVGQGQGPGQVNEQPAETVGQTTQTAVQPAGQGATAPSMGQPAGRTQAVPEVGQVSTAAEVLADRMEAIADEAMQLLVPPTSRMDEATAQKQRDFIFTLLVNGPYDSLAVMAADFGIKESQAKDWSAKAKAMQDDPTKLAAAFRAVADQHGITVAELMDGIGVKAAQEAAQAPEQVVAGTERELIDEGLEVKGRKSGESLQERYNKVETNQAKYLRLSEQLEAAENDGDEEAAARISAELDAVLAKGVEQSDKRSKRAAPKAAKAKTEAPTTAAEELSEDKRKAQEAEAAKLRAEIAAKTAAERKGLEVGDTVVNPKLGTGTVLSFAGNGASTTVTVKFKSGETKELSVAAAKLEKTNAVQEPSAEEVSVRQRARGGKAVGEGDTEGGKAAAEGKPAAEEIRTPQEQWEALADSTPGMPPYESLTKEERTRWDDLAHRGVANLSAANEIVGGSNPLASRSRNFIEFEDVEAQVSGIDDIRDELADLGIENALDFISDWELISDNSKDAFHGLLRSDNGRYNATVNLAKADTPGYAAEVAMHEIGHAVDMAPHGGVYSGQPEMSVSLKDGVVTPVGKIARELHALYKSMPAVQKFLEYPFNAKAHKELDSNSIIEMELFAQIFALYSRAKSRAFLEQHAPQTAAFMKEVVNDIKSTRALQVQKAETAAKRTLAFRNRGAAGGNQGAARVPGLPRREGPTALASRSKESLIGELPPAAQKPVRNSIASITDFANKAIDRVVFTSDLLSRAVDAGVSSAKKFERLLAERGTKARALERGVERIADQYATLPEKDKGTGPNSVNQFLFDSTRTMKWGYGKYRDAEMGARFDALDPKSQAFIKAVFAHGDKILSQKKQTVLDYASSEYDALIAATTDPKELAKLKADKAADLKKFASMFAIREGKPYAPIKRMGDYVVVAKSEAYRKAEELNDTAALNRFKADPDHYHVSFTQTKSEARALADQLREQGFFGASPDAVDFFEKTKFGRDEMANNSTLDALTRLRSVINARAAEGDKSAAAMQTLVTDLFLQNLSENSARKSEMRRRGVAGEVDMLRSFASQGRADAQFLASIEMNPQVQDAVQEMRAQVKQGGNRDRKSELMNEIMARYEKSLARGDTPTIDKLTRLSSIWYLATSPAYYFQNLTQPWMMSVPAMAGRHNYSSSSTALFKAYSELGPLMKSAKLFEQQFDFSKVPADVRAAIQELANRGKIDIGLETELGEFKIDGSGALTDRWNKVDKGMRIAVQKVEAINRLSTAIAAYRLELAKTGSAEKALDYADRILTETHGDYTAFNSPRVFNNPVGKVALQFRKFQLIQLTFYAKLIRDAYEGKDRAMALKTLAYSLGHTGMLAGVMGLPGYAAISAILGALLGDDDEEYDLTKELRTMIGDEDIANLILRGAPTIAGMDLSGKVGAGNMLSIMPFSNADLTTKSGVYEALGQLLGGAAAGMAAKFADGLGLMLSGDWYKGLEQMLPKGLADPMKAARIANEGMTRRNGDVVLPESEISSLDAVWQAIGLSPVKQAVVYERQQNIRDVGQKFQDRSTEIKNRYTKAAKSGDTAEMAAQREAWAKLQAARMNSGYTRQPMSELLKAPQDQAKRERQTVGGVQYNKANRAAVLAEANL